MKIAMTSIPVPDPSQAHKHYTEVLGFESKIIDHSAKLAIVVSPSDPNGTMLMLEPNEHPISKTYQESLYKAGIPIMSFGVVNLKEEYIRLVNLDVRFKKEPTEEAWGWDSIFDDQQGNWIQLIQL